MAGSPRPATVDPAPLIGQDTTGSVCGPARRTPTIQHRRALLSSRLRPGSLGCGRGVRLHGTRGGPSPRGACSCRAASAASRRWEISFPLSYVEVGWKRPAGQRAGVRRQGPGRRGSGHPGTSGVLARSRRCSRSEEGERLLTLQTPDTGELGRGSFPVGEFHVNKAGLWKEKQPRGRGRPWQGPGVAFRVFPGIPSLPRRGAWGVARGTRVGWQA